MNRHDKISLIGEMPMPAGFPYRSLFLKGRPQHEKYDDFWIRHPPMNHVHRTKIFAPFDALAGFGDCIAGKEIEYQNRRSLSEGEKEELDRKISILCRLTVNGKAARKNCPKVTVQYFVPCTDPNSDAYGIGGIYKTIEGICQKVNIVSRTITIGDRTISIDDIAGITGELFDHMDEEVS